MRSPSMSRSSAPHPATRLSSGIRSCRGACPPVAPVPSWRLRAVGGRADGAGRAEGVDITGDEAETTGDLLLAEPQAREACAEPATFTRSAGPKHA